MAKVWLYTNDRRFSENEWVPHIVSEVERCGIEVKKDTSHLVEFMERLLDPSVEDLSLLIIRQGDTICWEYIARIRQLLPETPIVVVTTGGRTSASDTINHHDCNKSWELGVDVIEAPFYRGALYRMVLPILVEAMFADIPQLNKA